jgi:hypothetical protein
MSLRLLRKYVTQLPVPTGFEPEGDPPDTDEEETPPGDDDGGDESGGSGDDDKPVTREEFQKLFQRMQAADRRASTAETKLKEKEKAELGDLERAQRDAKEAQDKLKEVQGDLQTERLHNAFLASNTVTWHDPTIAMGMLDLDGVQKDDGTIDHKALKAGITALAKEKPFLVKTEEEGQGGGRKTGPTGQPIGTGGGSKDGKENADREKLVRKYPALRR